MASTPQQPGETPRSPFPTSPPEGGKPPRPAPEETDDEKPADELTDEELRLMADTMPGDGPGDD